jgi:hypothetical protein
MVGNMVGVGGPTIRSGCLPISADALISYPWDPCTVKKYTVKKCTLLTLSTIDIGAGLYYKSEEGVHRVSQRDVSILADQ